MEGGRKMKRIQIPIHMQWHSERSARVGRVLRYSGTQVLRYSGTLHLKERYKVPCKVALYQ